MIASLGVVAPEWSVVAPEWLGWWGDRDDQSVKYVECPFFAKLVQASFSTPPNPKSRTKGTFGPQKGKTLF